MKCHTCGEDGHMARQCTWAEDLVSERLKAQHWRCARCRKVIYVWDKEVPCEHHRVVAEWQEYYGTDQFVTDAAETRRRIAEHRDPGREAKLRTIAAQQVAESRASRDIV